VLATSLTTRAADAEQVLAAYRSLQAVEYWFFRKFVPAVEALSDLVGGARSPGVAEEEMVTVP
jgi:hypothetical protein